jgi:hypothetical protein
MRRFQILAGPDRMELMSNFALRNPAVFKFFENNGEVKVVINGISMESADCHSWLIQGYVMDGVHMGCKVEGFYKTHPKYQGTSMKGFLDITPAPSGKSHIG